MLKRLVDKRFLAFDWDDRELRVVHASLRKGRTRVLSVQSVAVPEGVSPSDAASFGKLIRDFLHQEGIATRQAIFLVPQAQATVKRLKGLPPAKPEDLPGVIAMQFERELPYPASQAAVDFSEPVPDGPDSKTLAAVVAAVKNDVLEGYRSIAREAGLRLERVALRSHANRLALNAVLSPGRHERVLFVDVGPAFTEIDVVTEGQLVFTRAASAHVPPDAGVEEPEPSEDAAEGPATLDLDEPVRLSGMPARGPSGGGPAGAVNPLVLEVVRSIEAYRSGDPSANITHVVIGGSTGVEEALGEALRDRFDMTTELFNPAMHFGWDAERGAEAVGYAAALGLVLGEEQPRWNVFNFLSPKRVVTATEQQLQKLPLAIGGVAAAVVVILGLYFFLIQPESEKVAALEAQVEDAKKNRSTMKKVDTVLDDIEMVDGEQVIWLDEINDILDLLPENDELVLRTWTMRQSDIKSVKDRKGRRRMVEATIELDVRAKSNEVLTRAVDALQGHEPEQGDATYYDVRLGATSDTPGNEYPITGTIDVTVVGSRARPDLADVAMEAPADREST